MQKFHVEDLNSRNKAMKSIQSIEENREIMLLEADEVVFMVGAMALNDMVRYELTSVSHVHRSEGAHSLFCKHMGSISITAGNDKPNKL